MYRNVDGGANDGVRTWLQGFVHSMGLSAAARLLDGAGVVVRNNTG